MSSILLSIKPKYANAILNGSKTYEFRKIRCREDVDKIVIYASSPVKKIVGEAEIANILEDCPSKIWAITRESAGISCKDFFDYYRGHKIAIAYQLTNIIQYENPKELADYGITHAPQSFVYVEN